MYRCQMDGIGDSIRKLRREVEMALNDRVPVPSGVFLEADRVTVTLSIPPHESDLSPGFSFPSMNGTPHARRDSGNQLTIEFRVCSQSCVNGGETASNTVHLPVPVPPLVPLSSEELRKLILETGTAVFGAQGFDNSARAEVFCELVAGMDAENLQAALAAVEMGMADLPSALQRPVARLRQVLGFSPLGREKAAGQLLQVFRRCTVREVVTTLGETWRFGTHWPLAPAN